MKTPSKDIEVKITMALMSACYAIRLTNQAIKERSHKGGQPISDSFIAASEDRIEKAIKTIEDAFDH